MLESSVERGGYHMARSLAERLRAHEQQKARLAEEAAKLKDAERRARTRRLIEAGGLIEKVGLLSLDSNALYGALLSLRDGADDKSQIDKWSALGGRAFAREARQRDEGKEPIVLTFPGALDRDVTTALRAAGFRFNKVFSTGKVSRVPTKPRRSPKRMAAHSGGWLPKTPPQCRRSQQKLLNDRARDRRLVRRRGTHRHSALALVAVLVRLDLTGALWREIPSPSPTGPPRPMPSRIAAGRPWLCSARSC